MADNLIITVTGIATASRKAERATMHVQVSSEGQSQSEVAQNVTHTSEVLQQQFKRLAQGHDDGNTPPEVPVSEWTMSGLSTSSYQPWADEGEPPKPRVYSVSTSFEAVFRDFEELGRMATTMSEMPHVSIEKITWDITPETRAALGKKTRRGAVEDAIAKAADYAMATGRTRVVPNEISDDRRPLFGQEPTLHMARMQTARGGEPRQMNFTPETINVESAVVAKFTALWM